jgi:hypothetical protein
MATIRSFTSLEQSRKLAEFLPFESADMWYEDSGLMIPRLGHMPKEHTNTEVPCWSLTALFRLLPHSAQLEKGHSTELCRITLSIEYIDSDWYINPIDACYEVILKLHELNLL